MAVFLESCEPRSPAGGGAAPNEQGSIDKGTKTMAMMTETCRALPYEAADGPANMALDEAMLDLAAEEGLASAYLRIYGWTVPTLSLGYFQRHDEARADPRFRDVPIVRRLTGGGAIWHDSELTYALVVPAGHPSARPHTALYRAVHAAIGAALRPLAVPLERHGAAFDGDRAGRRSSRPFLCFRDQGVEDLVLHGCKILGSAQRRRRGALLQHGSLLLSASPRTPELPGIHDFVDVSRDSAAWPARLSEAIAQALGLAHVSVRATPGLHDRAAGLEASRYRDPGWTEAR